jgi:hypothetical protein
MYISLQKAVLLTFAVYLVAKALNPEVNIYNSTTYYELPRESQGL